MQQKKDDSSEITGWRIILPGGEKSRRADTAAPLIVPLGCIRETIEMKFMGNRRKRKGLGRDVVLDRTNGIADPSKDLGPKVGRR